MKKALAALFALVGCFAANAMEIRTQALNKEYGPFTGAVERGKWNTDFNACKQFADAHCVPMLVFWGHVGCEYCEYMITCLNLKYMNEYFDLRKMVMCFELAPKGYKYTSDADDKLNYPAKAWMKENGNNTSYPMMAVYWKKPDGTVTNSFFCGARTQTSNHGACMPVKEGCTDKKILLAVHKWNSRCSTAVMNNTMYMQLEGSIEQVIMDWDGSQIDETDGRFKLETTTLEAEMTPSADGVPGQSVTKRVYVPLVRDYTGSEITNKIVATWREESLNDQQKIVTNTVVKTIEVPWTNDVQVAYPAIDFVNPVLDDVQLVLVGETGDAIATSKVHVVSAQATSQENPLWIGERTAETLQAGEWTMDYAVATNRTAKQTGSAYTLVLVGGELWCPDCKGMRANLLETPAFKTWATDNNVSLVLVDIPKNYDDCAPTMLTFNELNGVSGAGYLSRKSVPPAEAEEMFWRNRTLCYETWNFLYEGRTRLWLPTALVLRKDGSLVSKLAGGRQWPDGTTFTVADYIRRFNEMLTLAEDPNEYENNDWTTTPETLSATAGVAHKGKLSAVDGRIDGDTKGNVLDYVMLTDVQTGFGITTSIATDDPSLGDAAVTLSILAVGSETNVVATTNIQLSAGGELTVQAKAGTTYYAKVSGNDPNGVFSYSNDVSSVRAYALAASTSLAATAEPVTVSVKAGTIGMKIDPTKTYCISSSQGPTSFSSDGLTKDLTKDNCYTVTDPTATEVTLTFNQACELTVSEWTPGTVAFGFAAKTYSEGGGACYVKLSRAGGSSGSAKVRVLIDGGDPAVDPLVYEWPRDGAGNPLPVEYEWASGVQGDLAVTNLIAIKRMGFFGDYTVNLKLEQVGETALGEQKTCAITIAEGDVASKGQIGIAATYPAMQAGKRIICAREGSVITNYAVRSVGFDSDIAATVSTTAGVLSTNRLEWYNRVSVTNAFTLTVPKLSEMKRGRTVTVTLKSADRTVPVVSAEKSVTVQILAANAPEFAVSALNASAAQYVNFSNDVAFVTHAEGTLSFKRTSGSLPGGIVARIVGNRLTFSGMPTRAGSYCAVFQAMQKIGTSTVSGGTVEVAITVRTLAEAGSIGQYLPTKSETHYGMAVQVAEWDGETYVENPTDFRTLAGMVTMTSNGRGGLTVSYESRYRKVSLKTTGWDSLSADGRTLTARAASGDYAFTFVASDTGAGAAGVTMLATMTDPYFPKTPLLIVFPSVVTGADAKAFVGNYNVNFASSNDETTVHLAASEAAVFENVPSGDAYIRLSITASGAKSGRVTYAGAVPNGTAISGSTLLFSFNGKDVFIPYFNRFSGSTDKHDVFAGALWISPDAATTWTEYPNEDGSKVGNRVISAAIPCAWHHIDTGLLEAAGTEAFDRIYGTFGGYYDTKLSLEDGLCADIDETVRYRMQIDPSTFPTSAVHGAVVSVAETADVMAQGNQLRLVADTRSNGLTFSFARSTGIFSGRFTVTFEDGKSLVAYYKGILLPAWGTGCGCYEIPSWAVVKAFGLGSVYYTDSVKVNVGTEPNPKWRTVSVKRGVKVEFWPVPEN